VLKTNLVPTRTGAIDATRQLADRTGMTTADIDPVETNEAIASVDIVNPNGGAVALGHPLGGASASLMTEAVHELERSDSSPALITMCSGGGLETGSIIEPLA